MKKLLTLVFAFWCGILTAQDSEPQHSLAVAVGPNLTYILDGDVSWNVETYPRVGFSTGLDYTYRLDGGWCLKASTRYCTLKNKFDNRIEQYEVENEAWQLFVGGRWMSRPKTWRWYGDAETGLTHFIVSGDGLEDKIRLTLGVGLGVSWQQPGRKTSIFAQPLVRYIFKNLNEGISVLSLRYLAPTIEVGVRRHF